MWHASVALRGPAGPVPTLDVGRKDRRLAQEIARRLVEGVGEGEIIEHTKGVAFHARRRLTDTELAKLDPAWLAIPAVDMG